MAGGSFITHNKVLPGAYINFISKARAIGHIGERGTVALALDLDWGAEENIIDLTGEDLEKNSLKLFGYEYTHDKLKDLREVFKYAKRLKLFRIGKGTKSVVTIGDLTVKAIFTGTRGNAIRVSIENAVDSGGFLVKTFMGNVKVDEQDVKSIGDLKDNGFVEFSGTGNLSANAGVKLIGGTNAVITNIEYSKFLEKLESEDFDVLICNIDDVITKGMFENFTKRMRTDEGLKFITVIHDYAKADYEGIISVKNDKNFIYWIGGALAGANINESLTYKKYNGEYDTTEKFSNSQMTEFLNNGQFLIFDDGKDLKVLKDINTFKTITPEKSTDFSNNQVVRILDNIANDIANTFKSSYLGKMQNDRLGRQIFKAEISKYFNNLQVIRAIDDFDTEDIEVLQGEEKGDVIVNVVVQPVACMDKIYMSCIIE